ncbi:unnamed protein product [Didymodactylos carnosus]|uniref:Acetate kinase n=1 Tax=Didymodactylos carnosus TaxID=1234261 RepID=A0A8S2H7K8_9BILA|nr:unnamed protein product [Didymodactylos carnosus]CAF3588590.1 unnamed protein product [Didymodactylos carnosus]
MGLTPLEGLIMGTRSGDIDPAIISYVAKQKMMSEDAITALLSSASGLKGLTGSSDMREVQQRFLQHDEQAVLAINL